MARNVELSEFLRRSRARITPESAGLPERGAYRRVPGLRREEVAHLAGVSTDYYTRLEQGRQITPSTGVLEAVASALRLDPAERAHLFDLAGSNSGSARRSAPVVQRVRPLVRRFLDSFTDQAGFILGRRTDVLATNHLARALLTDFEAMPARERNLARWILLDEAARSLYPDWEQIAAEMTAILRMDAGRHPDDTRTAELVGELALPPLVGRPQGLRPHARPQTPPPPHRRRPDRRLSSLRAAGRGRPDPVPVPTGPRPGLPGRLEAARQLERQGTSSPRGYEQPQQRLRAHRAPSAT
jgi:transcriptional regulator with XRE-family HTH domain